MAGLDQDAFEERAAIMEFDGGMSRFEAETQAARAQGLGRWEAIGAISGRLVERARHQRAMAEQSGEDDLPGVQPVSAQEVRSMPKREQD